MIDTNAPSRKAPRMIRFLILLLILSSAATAQTRRAPREQVIGSSAEAMIRQFGTPRLDIHDGDARKLQWTGPDCVLDAYLYPGTVTGQPVVTYIEARRGDGSATESSTCIAALRRN